MLSEVDILKGMTQGKRSGKEQSSIMTGIGVSLTLRAVIATVLWASFVIYPQLRVSSAKTLFLITYRPMRLSSAGAAYAAIQGFGWTIVVPNYPSALAPRGRLVVNLNKDDYADLGRKRRRLREAEENKLS